MKRAAFVVGAFAIVLVVLVLALIQTAPEGKREPVAAGPPLVASSAPPITPTDPAPSAQQGFLYGRVTATDGTTYVGRLRMGGGEEAFWSDYFNGAKQGNPWAEQVEPERLTERVPVEFFGLRFGSRERPIDLDRPFMVRFGDVERLDARGRDLWVTVKSGTVFQLDRYGPDDFADGVRVWDERHGVVDLRERQVRSIELFPTARLDDAPARLHGTVHTPQGVFTGSIQWNREHSVGSDELMGDSGEGRVRLRFDTVRSIARHGEDGSRVTLADGRELVLTGTPEAGDGHRGVFVDDPRYGRVLVSWDAFERLDLAAGDSGPAYDDFAPGRALTGHATTRDGRRLAGRLVYDLDESETTETLDAPSGGVNYSLPFGLVASIALPGGEDGDSGLAKVTLRDGTELELERRGDLADTNAGLLVFVEGSSQPEYVPWADVAQVDLDHPPTVELPLGGL